MNLRHEDVKTRVMLGSINISFLRNLVQNSKRSVSFNFTIQINLLRLADYKCEICGCQSKWSCRARIERGQQRPPVRGSRKPTPKETV